MRILTSMRLQVKPRYRGECTAQTFPPLEDHFPIAAILRVYVVWILDAKMNGNARDNGQLQKFVCSVARFDC